MTSVFPTRFGNAITGVFDLRTRNGNTEKNEYLAQIGFNGIEISVEGPLNKETKSSFLVGYRYSTVKPLQKLGLMPVQDRRPHNIMISTLLHEDRPLAQSEKGLFCC